MNSLVSIIMPVYNAERFISEAINSVLDQTYPNWELLIINDGSSDGSVQIIKTFKDKRIRFFDQSNQGVSAARNVGLKNMMGDYFCFLDGDDVFTPDSLSCRLKLFSLDETVDFVDGKVIRFDDQSKFEISSWTPSYEGKPLNDLVTLGQKTFFGITWMIRRKMDQVYEMEKGLTHGEDLLFLIQVACNNGNYTYTDHIILNNRVHGQSAMNNLDGLATGYRYIYSKLKSMHEIRSVDISKYRRRVNRILILSYFRKMQFSKGLKSLI